MDELAQRVDDVRRFNRFYTQRLGVLRQGWLRTPLSLTEVRVLYEVAHRHGAAATELGRDLGLDPGYLSRVLARLRRRGLVTRRRSPADGRQLLLRLTDAGREAFAVFDERANDEVAALLGPLSASERRRLTGAMATIEGLIGRTTSRAPWLLRTHRAGDLGWVVQRHGVIYGDEYGWGEPFEALVARIAADFLQGHDPTRERCWIAERDGANVGSVMLVAKSPTVAQLRLLLVEPSARGLGIGGRLVDECVRFAREARYRRIILWTQNVLHAARRTYERAGFRLVHEQPNRAFGRGLRAQTWELPLGASHAATAPATRSRQPRAGSTSSS